MDSIDLGALPTYLVRVLSKEDGKRGSRSSTSCLMCIAARAEQRHTSTRYDAARCRFIGLNYCRSTVVVYIKSTVVVSSLRSLWSTPLLPLLAPSKEERRVWNLWNIEEKRNGFAGKNKSDPITAGPKKTYMRSYVIIPDRKKYISIPLRLGPNIKYTALGF